MPILLAIGLIALLLAIYLPQHIVRHIMETHSAHRDDYPGSGGELAEHLIRHYQLDGVKVEETEKGDHYDPNDRVVRLSKDNMHGRSITAVAVAAHEVGHAIQHFHDEKGLRLRQVLVRYASVTDLFATIFFIAAPILFGVLHSPGALFGLISIAVGLLGFRLLVHLVTLPVEYDASFGKALPILRAGGYISEADIKAARRVLTAAALTYVSAALAGLLNLARWVRMLR